jgi:hypothetical protein
MMHLIACFIGKLPLTKCGIYAENNEVTGYIVQVTCKRCRASIGAE